MRMRYALTLNEEMVRWIMALPIRQRSAIVEQLLENSRGYIKHIDARGHVTFNETKDDEQEEEE